MRVETTTDLRPVAAFTGVYLLLSAAAAWREANAEFAAVLLMPETGVGGYAWPTPWARAAQPR